LAIESHHFSFHFSGNKKGAVPQSSLPTIDCFAGIARAFTYGGSRNRKMHDPAQAPRTDITKSEYTSGDAHPTTINHFAEKLLKLKDLMKSEVIRRMCLLKLFSYISSLLCWYASGRVMVR